MTQNEIFLPLFLASSITSFLFLTFVSCHAGVWSWRKEEEGLPVEAMTFEEIEATILRSMDALGTKPEDYAEMIQRCLAKKAQQRAECGESSKVSRLDIHWTFDYLLTLMVGWFTNQEIAKRKRGNCKRMQGRIKGPFFERSKAKLFFFCWSYKEVKKIKGTRSFWAQFWGLRQFWIPIFKRFNTARQLHLWALELPLAVQHRAAAAMTTAFAAMWMRLLSFTFPSLSSIQSLWARRWGGMEFRLRRPLIFLRIGSLLAFGDRFIVSSCTSSYVCVCVSPFCCGRSILRVSKQGRLNNSTKYPLHALMTTTLKKKNWNLLENCHMYALKLF